MLNFATEIRQLVQGIGALDTVAVKLASAEGSALAQRTVAEGAHGLFEVFTKKASAHTTTNLPKHVKVVVLVEKLASLLGRPSLSPPDRLEIASAVVVDDAISSLLEKGANDKLSEVRAYGREFFVDRLRKAL